MLKITNDGLTRSGRGRRFISCTHMATVGVKGLSNDNVCPSVCLFPTLTRA